MKYSLLFLMFFSVLLVFAACGERDPADALISPEGHTDFTIVRPDIASQSTIDSAIKLRSSINEKTGVNFVLTTDFTKPNSDTFIEGDYEIIIGNANRAVVTRMLDSIPRLNDWIIAREGGKIVICSVNKISEAVDYFVEHYIADKNIYIPDGERVVHTGDYKYDSILINGAELNTYKVYYGSGANSAECAQNFCNLAAAEYGYPMTPQGYRANSVSERYVYIYSDDLLGEFNVSCRVENGNLLISCGLFADINESLKLLTDYFNDNAADKILTLDASFKLEEVNMDERITIADTDYLNRLDEKANKMKQAVLSTDSEYTLGAGGKVYYFSESGNDSNDGLSEDKPLCTIEKLSILPLKSGDAVLFRRGDLFRGNIKAVGGVTYSAYGDGDKPIISSSRKNYADPLYWNETEYENVWVCTEKLVNVGIVALDHSGELGKYDELVGDRMVAGRDDFNGASDMNKDLQVWSDLDSDKLYFYSAEGNPGERYKSIEIGERGNTIAVSAGGVTVDNLHITLTGSHGIGAGTTKNLTVRNCIFDWLGGSILTGFGGANITGYGNAVEVYGGVDGYSVYNNWIYQIYDTGITHQFSKTPTVKTNIMNNVEYFDNLIEYCFWSIEYYNASGGEGTYRETTNIYVHDNFCRFGGYGWGCKGRASSAPMYSLGSAPDKTENYLTENNIFDRCLGTLVSSYDAGAASSYQYKGNTYIQPYNVNFARIGSQIYVFDANAANVLETDFSEKDPKLVFIIEDDKKPE